jgi:anti-anti-sigma regulatory factor
MPLEILKKKNEYHLNGKVITPNIDVFLEYFNNKIEKKKKIILNIEKTISIDKSGLEAIQQLMNLATLKEKKFRIVGGGCKEIYEHFNLSTLN